MKTKSFDNSGFTLVELLTVIAIIGILASIAMQGYAIYRTTAYRSRIIASMDQLKVALEAGATNHTGGNPGFLWTFTGDPGAPTLANAEDVVPGFVNTEGQFMHAWFSGDCDAGLQGNFCAQESASVWSCKTGYQTTFTRFKDGRDFTWSWQGVPWC